MHCDIPTSDKILKRIYKQCYSTVQSFLIVADGDFLAREIILEAAQDKTIIALDGAANRLRQRQILPHCILGDLDAIGEAGRTYWGIKQLFSELNENAEPYTGNHNVTIIPILDQNRTDLIKAIHYCNAQGATSIEIVCAVGGRIDQHEGVIRALRREYNAERIIQIHTEQQTLRFAKDETIEFQGEIGDKCGVLAYPAASFTSQGLYYDVENYQMKFGFNDSTCNFLRLNKASVTVQGEALLVMPAILKAQRVFMRLSETERLQKLLSDIAIP